MLLHTRISMLENQDFLKRFRHSINAQCLSKGGAHSANPIDTDGIFMRIQYVPESCYQLKIALIGCQVALKAAFLKPASKVKDDIGSFSSALIAGNIVAVAKQVVGERDHAPDGKDPA